MDKGNPERGDGEPVEANGPTFRRAGVTLVGSAVGGALVILAEFLAARHLQVEAYGLYASGMTIARIVEALAIFGLPVAIFHFLPHYRLKGLAESVAGTVYAAGLLPFAIGSAFGAAVWLLAPFLALNVFRNEQAVDYIRLLAVAAPFMAGAEVLGSITRGFGHAVYYVIVKNLIPPVFFLAALGVMALSRAQAIWITGAVVFGSLTACLAGIAAILHIAGLELRGVRPVFRLRELYGYSAGVMANYFFYLVFALTGLLAVAYFMGTESVGIYRVCLQLVVPIDMVLLAFHAAMGPIYPVLARENRIAELEEAYGAAIRWMVLLQLPIGIVLAWNARDILTLVSPAFTEGAVALMIMAVGYSMSACFGTIAYLLMLSGRQTVETWNAASVTTLNVLLAIVLVPRLGLTGAALASTASYILLNILRLFEVRRLMRLRTFRPYFLWIFAVSAAAVPGAHAVLQLAELLQSQDVLSLALRIAAALAVHALALWTIGLDRKDKDLLRTALTSLSRRGHLSGKPS